MILLYDSICCFWDIPYGVSIGGGLLQRLYKYHPLCTTSSFKHSHKSLLHRDVIISQSIVSVSSMLRVYKRGLCGMVENRAKLCPCIELTENMGFDTYPRPMPAAVSVRYE